MSSKTTVDELAQAFIAGAAAVHDEWLENPGEAPRGDPEFDEAAYDYARHVFTPPSDDLRAAMEALRAGGNPTNNTIDDAYIGRMFDNCNAVLAAWDRQQGERS